MTGRPRGGPSFRRIALGAALLVAVMSGAAAVAAWSATYDRAIRALAADGAARLSFIAQSLESEFVRYKLLAKSLSQTGVIRRRAVQDFTAGEREAEALMARMAAISGARDIRFATPATARGGPERAAVSRAYQGVMGFAFAPEDDGVFMIAAPVRDGAAVVGALVVTLDAASLEWSWRALREVVFVTGGAGEIRLSSLPALRLLTLRGADAQVPDPQQRTEGGRLYWRFADPAWAALGVDMAEALALVRPSPAIEMTAYALVDTAPARRDAWLAAAAVAAAVLALGLVALVILQRRAALAARLALEARTKAELEIMVADRTAELTVEIAERRATEKRLRETQEDLVQAGKLSALGQMAAGIAHEINQPLAAIRSFADNAAILLDRGRGAEAKANLEEIGGLTARAARIIRNLRAFARNEPAETEPTPVAPVVEDALAILAPRLREAGARVDWAPPASGPVAVGGAVRLQQVLVNLIANGLDAQAGAAEPVIEISAAELRGRVRIAVRDHGPGLSPAARERIFDPFFTTKTVGEGTGLGLSISFNIVRSFGGELTAANHPDGGAVFTVALRPAPAREAAA